MTNAIGSAAQSLPADRTARVRRLDVMAAILIGAVGIALASAAVAEFVRLYEVGTCPSGHYCSFVQGIVGFQLLLGVLTLVLGRGSRGITAGSDGSDSLSAASLAASCCSNCCGRRNRRTTC
jgi:uncharacterized membrane protein YeaQ/YmgE (transglycosylase-associated protein family)